jgi:hypothetical protein
MLRCSPPAGACFAASGSLPQTDDLFVQRPVLCSRISAEMAQRFLEHLPEFRDRSYVYRS